MRVVTGDIDSPAGCRKACAGSKICKMRSKGVNHAWRMSDGTRIPAE